MNPKDSGRARGRGEGERGERESSTLILMIFWIITHLLDKAIAPKARVSRTLARLHMYIRLGETVAKT